MLLDAGLVQSLLVIHTNKLHASSCLLQGKLAEAKVWSCFLLRYWNTVLLLAVKGSIYRTSHSAVTLL